MLCAADIQQWRTRGYALVHDFLPALVTHAAVHAMHEHLPQDKGATMTPDFGNDNALAFPCNDEALDAVPLHPRLLHAACTLLQTSYVRLHQAVAWGKYGLPRATRTPSRNDDQRLHQDFGNNMFGVPYDWDTPEAVAAIVYYSDVSETGGATAVLPRVLDVAEDADEADGARTTLDPMYADPSLRLRNVGMCGVPFRNNRADAEALLRTTDPHAYAVRAKAYRRERKLTDARVGSVLFYRLDVWHRGTPVHEGRMRYTHNFVWSRPDVVGLSVWNGGLLQKMYSGWLERWMARATPPQLMALGFPPPWSHVWTSAAYRRAVASRYNGLDVEGYAKSVVEPVSLSSLVLPDARL